MSHTKFSFSHQWKIVLFFLLISFSSPLIGEIAESLPLKTLLSSLDPLSLSQHMTFYRLYPESREGQQALSHAFSLLKKNSESITDLDIDLPPFDILSIISLITKLPHEKSTQLTDEQLKLIENLSVFLPHRKLPGHYVEDPKKILTLPPEEIDIARGLLLYQFENEEDRIYKIRQYEAMIDLMALQIQLRLKENPTPLDKIREINRLVFLEMEFKFPPHSVYVKDIDIYTFLPSVLDGRQGVCLGVSILYLCLAQRLDLSLEIILPPGHIYVRYRDEHQTINIETTARGVNLPTETYLGINTRSLVQATQKEVIGTAFINQASLYWGKEDYQTAVKLYEKAQLFLPSLPSLKMFLGFNYLFTGKKTAGKKLLEEVRYCIYDDAVSIETMPEDYLSGKVDLEGIKTIFLQVDPSLESIKAKQNKLKKVIARYPKFRAGLQQLAITWLQLGRSLEAKKVLEQYHQLDPSDVTVEYYLSVLSLHRMDYNQAWKYLKNCERLEAIRQHKPRALKELRQTLVRTCPDSI